MLGASAVTIAEWGGACHAGNGSCGDSGSGHRRAWAGTKADGGVGTTGSLVAGGNDLGLGFGPLVGIEADGVGAGVAVEVSDGDGAAVVVGIVAEAGDSV